MKTPPSALVRSITLFLIAVIICGCTAESKKAHFLERAERFFKAGDYDKAKIEYLNLLRIDPQNATPYARLGLMWLEEAAPLRAGPFLVKAKELAPGDLQNRAKLARVFSAVGQRAQARNEALAVLEQSPANGEALMILVETSFSPEEITSADEQLKKFPEREAISFLLASANLALRKGDPGAAESDLQRALSLDAKSAAAHSAMGVFRLFQKNIPQSGEEFKLAAELAPPRSNEALKYAEFKLKTGAGDEAKDFLTRVVAQTPDFVGAWSLQAQIALRENKPDEALKLLENVFTRDPDNLDARMAQAGAWLAKGENKKASESLARLDRAYPNSPLIKFRLGQAHLQNGNAAQAIAALDQALSANPNYGDALLLRAEIRLRAREPQPVIFDMVQLLKTQPDLIQARALLADAYRQLGRLDDAAAVMQEQINLLPQSSQAYEMLGVILRQQNKPGEARKAIEMAAELKPGNQGTVNQLVELDISVKDFDSARKRVQQLREKTAQSAAAYLIEGKIEAAEGKIDRAEAAFSKAIDLDPNSSTAYDFLVSLYVSANRLPDALRQLETLLAKKPNDVRALTVAALLYEKTSEWEKAREAYKKILEVTPNSVAALNNLAYLYAERFNELAKANELARKAHSTDPANPSPTDTLGWILYKQGDYQQAVTLLQESSEKLPDNPEAQFHFGMANYMMGKTKPARTALEKASSSAVDFPGKEEARRRLALLGDDDGQSKQLSTADLEALLRDQPTDPVALIRLGESYEQQGDIPKAAGVYERAYKLNPKLVSAVVKLAELNAGPLRNKAKAFAYAKEARELAPNDPKAAGRLGSIAYQTGNFQWAYSLLQESARQIPDDRVILHDLAWAAYSQGRIAEARQTMERLVRLAPEQAEDAKTFLSLTALYDGATPPAEAGVNSALASNPRYAPALMARATSQRRRGDLKAAEADYVEVLNQFPDFAPAQKFLAMIFAEDPSTVGRAYDLAAKARKTLSADPELIKTFGIISYQKKEFPRAIQLLQESGTARPLSPETLYFLGMSHLGAGHLVEGRDALSRALGSGLPPGMDEAAKRALSQVDSAKKL